MPAMTTKRIPERMCISCRQMKPKNELLRVVNTTEGVVVDLTGKLSGRGVYVCKCAECVDRTLKNKKFEKVNGFSLNEVKEKLESLVEQ